MSFCTKPPQQNHKWQKKISFSNPFSARQDLKEISVSLYVKTYNTVGKHKLNTEDLTKRPKTFFSVTDDLYECYEN